MRVKKDTSKLGLDERRVEMCHLRRAVIHKYNIYNVVPYVPLALHLKQSKHYLFVFMTHETSTTNYINYFEKQLWFYRVKTSQIQ